MMDLDSDPRVLKRRKELADTLERTRHAISMSLKDWADLLGVRSSDYEEIRKGRQDVSLSALIELAKQLDLSLERLMDGGLDFQAITARHLGERAYIPEKYTIAALSRRWSSVNYLKYVEDFMGWRLRHEALSYLQVPETVFMDPDGLINVRFITDLFNYLNARGVNKNQFYTIGAYSVVTYQDAPVGKEVRKVRSILELYQKFLEELIPLHLEKNCKYRLLNLTSTSCLIEVIETPGLAEALGMRKLGSEYFCQAKVGLTASLPGYLGLPFAESREVSCAHLGDSACRFEVDFSRAHEIGREHTALSPVWS
jgi:transcriptional regulator with XRE-family HTH domain